MISQINNEERDYKLEAYDYLLDPSLIASKPSAIRHESRLMIVRNSVLEEDCLTNKFTKNLLDEFREGDLVVVNNTKVMKARLKVELENKTLVELLVLERSHECVWLCLAKPAKKLKINRKLKLKSLSAQDINLIVDGVDEETGGRFIKFPENITGLNEMNDLLDKYGEETADEVSDLLSQRHDIRPREEEKAAEVEFEEQVPIAVGATAGGGGP